MGQQQRGWQDARFLLSLGEQSRGSLQRTMPAIIAASMPLRALSPGFAMPGWLYEAGPYGLLIFVLVTLILGGSAAFVSGRALAQTWRPIGQTVIYMILLAAAVRFVHFAIFAEPLLSIRNYLVDFVVLISISLAGYKLTRGAQMDAQYGWRGGHHGRN